MASRLKNKRAHGVPATVSRAINWPADLYKAACELFARKKPSSNGIPGYSEVKFPDNSSFSFPEDENIAVVEIEKALRQRQLQHMAG